LDEHTELVLSNYINTRLIEEVDIISRTLSSLNP